MGGATFPTVILLKSKIDRHPPGSFGAIAGISPGLCTADKSLMGIRIAKKDTLHQYKGDGCVNKKTVRGMLNRISSCNRSCCILSYLLKL